MRPFFVLPVSLSYFWEFVGSRVSRIAEIKNDIESAIDKSSAQRTRIFKDLFERKSFRKDNIRRKHLASTEIEINYFDTFQRNSTSLIQIAIRTNDTCMALYRSYLSFSFVFLSSMWYLLSAKWLSHFWSIISIVANDWKNK